MFAVWMHKEGRVEAVGAWTDRKIADAYALYNNRRSHVAWFEVRQLPAEHAV